MKHCEGCLHMHESWDGLLTCNHHKLMISGLNPPVEITACRSRLDSTAVDYITFGHRGRLTSPNYVHLNNK